MRPRVLVNMAPSLDGKIAPARRHGRFVMSRHGEDAKRMRALRERADAVVVGATNVRVDDPDLMPSPLRVVVTRAGEGLSPAARMFDASLGGEAVVACSARMLPGAREPLAAVATVVELGESEVDPQRLLQWLARERGCEVVLCEGGGVLNAALLAARAVDELYMTLVPRVLGGHEAPTLTDGAALDELPDARLVVCDRVGDELFLCYAFDWSAAPEPTATPIAE
jgi:riboflavin-specific deaminase-like protein